MGYNGAGPVAGGTVVGGTLAITGVDTLLWAVVGVAVVLAGLVLVRLSMARRTRGD
ncbi:MAG TPA: hypothetical protein VGR21_01385 [Cryptosporangiaceae bacterium]|nr:hypothetical protein [Cryptosporangiaceae bacterium]